MVFYNKTLFERAGRADPGPLWAQKRWNWQTFVDTVRGLHPPGGGSEPPYIAYQLQTWNGEFFSVVRSGGGDVLNADRTQVVLDQPAALETLEKWVELSARYNVTPPAVPLPQGGFNSGLVDMRFGVGSQVPGIRDALKRAQASWTWDAVPTPPDRTQTPTLFIGGYALWKGARHAPQAVTFLKYLLTDEPMLIRAELGGRMPSRAKLLPEFGRRLNIPAHDPKALVKAVEEVLPKGRGLPHTPTFPAWRDIIDRQVLLPALRGERAVRDALQAAKPAILAELSKGT